MGNKHSNVVFIMFDQMRFDCAGFMGNPHVHTPTMDRIAREGVCMHNAYCSSPQCSPARASWLSGLYPHAHRQLTNYGRGKMGIDGHYLPTDIRLFTDVLGEHGYQGGLVGPWHLGHDEQPQHGMHAIWKTYKYCFEPNTDAYQTYLEQVGWEGTPYVGRNGSAFGFVSTKSSGGCFADVAAIPTKHQRTTWTVREGIRFIESQKEDPFFLFLSIKDPHPPIIPPAECYEMYDPAELPLPAQWNDSRAGKPKSLNGSLNDIRGCFSNDVFREVMAHYYALITHIDNQLAKLFDALQSTGHDGDTLVAIISDHGEMLGQHGLFAKRTFYEGSVRVPCLFWQPDTIAQDTRIMQPFGGVDFAPTLLDLVGINDDHPTHGTSFADAIRTGDEPHFENTVLSEIGDVDKHNEETGMDRLASSIMIRRGDWKYILHRFDECDELYNLTDDPEETVNLSTGETHRAVKTDLHRAMCSKIQTDVSGLYDWVRHSKISR